MFFKQLSSFFFSKFPSFAYLSVKDISIPKGALMVQLYHPKYGDIYLSKTRTKVEVKFNVESALWMTSQMKTKFIELNKKNINKNGDFLITSDKTKDKQLNIMDATEKIKYKVWLASLTNQERSFIIPEPTEEKKRKRVVINRQRSVIKKLRRNVRGL